MIQKSRNNLLTTVPWWLWLGLALRCRWIRHLPRVPSLEEHWWESFACSHQVTAAPHPVLLITVLPGPHTHAQHTSPSFLLPANCCPRVHGTCCTCLTIAAMPPVALPPGTSHHMPASAADINTTSCWCCCYQLPLPHSDLFGQQFGCQSLGQCKPEAPRAHSAPGPDSLLHVHSSLEKQR